MKNNLMWFRNDLRVFDNTALHYACSSHQDKVIGLFIDTPKQWHDHYLSTKKISFIHQHVKVLQKALMQLNIILYYHQSTDFVSSVKYLTHFCKKYKINNIFYNNQYEANEKNRDNLVKKKLSEQGILVNSFDDSLLISHHKIKNNQHQTYKIFSFFKNKIIYHLSKNVPECFPIPIPRKSIRIDLKRNFFIKNYIINFNTNTFPIGEKIAHDRLKTFCTFKILDYSLNRNYPSLNGTSMLSPYLSIGVISPRYCLNFFLKKHYYNNTSITTLLHSPWINEIIWREFYYHLLIGFSYLSKYKALIKWEKNIQWINNSKYFSDWKNGNTGVPIVDAGMRQLNQTGWMHNRLRMITAHFLVKNLFINWRKGEKYFMSKLIDGDFALNNGGWQWSASIGTDSVPYIRILNPFNQSKKFDKTGAFIKKYLPELKIIPDAYIYNPYEWIKKNNCKIDYPKPIVNYNFTRNKTLLIYNQARSKK